MTKTKVPSDRREKNIEVLERYNRMPRHWKTDLIEEFGEKFKYKYSSFNVRLRSLSMSEVELDFINDFFRSKGYDL